MCGGKIFTVINVVFINKEGERQVEMKGKQKVI